MRLYHYVGPAAIRQRCAGRGPAGWPIHTPADLIAWLPAAGQRLTAGAQVTVTHVVDTAGRLLVADRHSEHVACAGGQPVLSAGELTLALEGAAVRVTAISNQSTGYCPEPESWTAVEAALTRAGLVAPQGFTPACVFRMCAACSEKCIVKDEAFECLMCGAELPREYNCQPV
jgi:hypothetical protein